MSTPKSYYDWLARDHGISTSTGVYEYVFYDYYAGDELQFNNVVFKDSKYVTFDNTHLRALNKSDIHMYDTSDIKIYDSGSLSMYTSAMTISAGETLVVPTTSFEITATSVDSELQNILTLYTATTSQQTDEYTNTISTTSVTTLDDLNLYMTLYDAPTAVLIGASLTAVSGITDTSAITAVSGLWIRDEYETPTTSYSKMFTVDNKGRVGIGIPHETPHGNSNDNPVYDLDVRGTVGINNFIYHNTDPETYILFGATSATKHVSLSGEPDITGPTEFNQITFSVSGVESLALTPQGLKIGEYTFDGSDISLLRSYSHISTTVSENSAAWLFNTEQSVTELTTTIVENSGTWNDTHTVLSTNSSDWDLTYATVTANSAQWSQTADLELQELQQDVASLQTNDDAQDTNISLLQTTVVRHGTDINNVESDVSVLQSTTENHATTLQGHDQEINNIRGTANSASSKADTNATDITSLEESTAAISQRVTTLETESTPGLYSRETIQISTTVISPGLFITEAIPLPNAYMLLWIETATPTWVTLYTDASRMNADLTRNQNTDPSPGSGVIAEVITTGSTRQLITPAACGFVNDGDQAYVKVANPSTGSAYAQTITFCYVQLEA